MGKVRYTREQFNNLRVLICIRPMLYGSKHFEPGDIFPVNKRDKKAITRARQLYQTRKIDYKDNYTAKDIRAIKKVFKQPVKRVRKPKPDPAAIFTTTTTTTSTSSSTTTPSTSSTTTTTTV